MLFGRTIHQEFIGLVAVACFGASLASAASFGKVVPIAGTASDIALDEGRGVLYIADYTAASIDVMSTSDYTIGRSVTVPAYPGGVAMSPDGHYLVVTHYASSAGAALAQPGQNALTVIDLNSNQKRTYGLTSGPVGLAFGIDGLALILTQDEFLLFNPASGATTSLGTVANVKSQTLPADQNNFPPQILAGSVTATADGRHILGIGGTTPDTGDKSLFMLFSYNVATRALTAAPISSAPSLGPRVISVARDASYFMTGWALIGCGAGFLGDCTANGPLLAQWPNASGLLNVGSVAIRSTRSLIYAQLNSAPPPASSNSQTVCLPNGTCVTVTTPGSTTTSTSVVPPNLLVLDADNLTVRDRIQLPENLAGKSIFNSDESVLYSISDSGVTVFPMAQLDKAPRVVASAEDVVFRGSFCNGGPVTQQLTVADPSGNKVPFSICATGSTGCLPPGVSVTPAAAITPATVTISIDPTVIRNQIGTTSYTFEILSSGAVNMPAPPSRGRVESYTANVRSRFRLLINNREPENRGAFFNAPGELVETLADPSRNRFYILRLDKNQVLVYDSTTYGLIATLRTGNTPMSMAITFDGKYLLVGNDNSQIANRFDLDTLQPMAPILFTPGHYPRSIAASGKAVLAASRVAGPVHTIDAIDLVSSTAAPLPSLGPYKNDINVNTKLVAAPNGATIMAAMPDGRMLLYSANSDSFTISRKDYSALQGAIAASSFGSYVVDRYLLNDSLVTVGLAVAPGDSSSGFAFVDQDGYSTAVASTGYGYIRRLPAGSAVPLPTMIVEAPTLANTDLPFLRTLAPLSNRSAIIALTTSGFTVLPWAYDAFTAPPVLDHIVNAADFTKPIAPGGLVSIFGSQLSPLTLSSTDVPLPTVLADSCLTVNGVVVPLMFVSPTQINGQLPFQATGNADVVLRTPGGISDSLKTTIFPAAPSVFRSGTAGPDTGIATIVRAVNNGLVTVSNPIHPSDHITIYLTGMGQTLPQVDSGTAAPADPLTTTLLPATVTLGGIPLQVEFSGLTPGLVGVYQINASVPFKGVPTGFEIPLAITQGGGSTTLTVRVVN